MIPYSIYDPAAARSHPERTKVPPAVLQRTIQVFGICQNLCLNEKNVAILVRSAKFMELLYKGLTSTVVVVRNCSLSLLESIAPVFALRPDTDARKEPLYISCIEAVFSDDYYAILTSLRFLTQLTNIEQNERPLFGDPHFIADVQSLDDQVFADLPGFHPPLIQRLGHLLFTGDQALIYESLEYLYAVTKLGDFMTARVVQTLALGRPGTRHGGLHIVKTLLNLVCWQQYKLIVRPDAEEDTTRAFPVHEPQRCIAWYAPHSLP